jgi:hypothetical protein
LTNLGTGTYSYIVTYEWTDNQGKIVRSTPSVPQSVVYASGTANVTLMTLPTLRLTAKSLVRIVVYRTEANNTTYYRATSVLNPIYNDPNVNAIAYVDSLPDSSLISRERLYTEGGVLDNAAPPSAKLITTYANRVWIAGIGDPYTLWHSKSLVDGEVMEFAAELTVKCDPRGGAITALASLDSALIVFKRDAIFSLSGDGPDNTGNGQAYTSPTLITTDVGCSTPNSIAITSAGVFFQSSKGIMLLDRSGNASYIGAPVERYNSLTVTSTTVVADQNIIIFTTNSDVALVYDYFFQQWSTFTGHAAVDSIMWGTKFCFLKSSGQVAQQNKTSFTDGSSLVKLKAKIAWIQMSGLQGFQRVRSAAILGEFAGPHKLNIDVSYDFNDTAFDRYVADATALFTSNTWGSSGTWGSDSIWGGTYTPYHFVIPSLHRQTCQALSITIQDSQDSGYNEGYSISGITLEIGTKRGLNKVPQANKLG